MNDEQVNVEETCVDAHGHVNEQCESSIDHGETNINIIMQKLGVEETNQDKYKKYTKPYVKVLAMK